MKLVPFLAATNAALATVSALLGAAPFVPAIALFLVYTPLAAVFAYKNQTVAALVVVGAAVLAWFLSPIEFDKFHSTAPLVWLAWVAFWSAVVIYVSTRKFKAASTTTRDGGTHGA
jgi:hypothetical protein